MTSQAQPRVLRKAPTVSASPAHSTVAVGSQSSRTSDPVDDSDARAAASKGADPFCLLDGASWQMLPQAAAEVLTSNQSFSVVGVLGSQGLGKSAFLNQLLGFCGGLPAAGPAPTPAFSVWHGAAAHCTRGVALRVSSDRMLALDTQPLFSISVLAEMAGNWDSPPAALAVPAGAAAGEGKASALPFEGVQVLAQLQMAVLLLSTCHRVLVFCDGWHDHSTWELLQTAEMLARGIPDPSLPAPGMQHQSQQQQPAAPAGAAAAAAAAGAAAAQSASQLARQAPPQEHLAEVVLVHVVPSGSSGGTPSEAQIQLLERQVDAFFATSRLRRPGALRMLDYMRGSSSKCAGSSMSYFAVPAVQCGAKNSPAWAQLVAALLARPCAPFARACTEQQWLRGFVGESWRGVRKSVDIANFYSRFARTVLRGGAGFGLAQ